MHETSQTESQPPVQPPAATELEVTPEKSLTRAYLALASVCFFWGTTYLGIRMALEGFAPTVLISLRFLFSGGLLLAFLLLRGYRLPPWPELWRTALTGVIIIGGGNGFLTYAEQIIPSGLAAIFITLAPFWFVGLDSLLPNGPRLHGPTLLSMGIGLVGAVVLALPSESYPVSTRNILLGALMLQAGSALWAGGSVLQRRITKAAHPFMAGAVQQLAVGVVFAPFALGAHLQNPVVFDARPTWALGYLVVFGAIVGYSSYIYALSHLPVSVVSVYNYVNPVVAVALGWLFYREPFGYREAAGMMIIFVGVALVKRFSMRNKTA
ncbi:MAG: EamA family transporter [Bryobacterales bacterium]|nr:EamA family transporter [Bryobacterales bacterium]